MRLPVAALGAVLLAAANAQNDTFNAQRVQPSLYTPASSPAKCSPDGTITVTQLNQAFNTQYLTQWKTTTYTDSQPAKTITTCTGTLGGHGSTTTVTSTITTGLSCTGKATTVTSYQNCIPVSPCTVDVDETSICASLYAQNLADSPSSEPLAL